MEELCFTKVMTVQACQAQEVHGQFTIQNLNHLMAIQVHQDYIEMDLDIKGLRMLVISVYIR